MLSFDNTKLLNAIIHGDLTTVKQQLNNGADPNVCYKFSKSEPRATIPKSSKMPGIFAGRLDPADIEKSQRKNRELKKFDKMPAIYIAVIKGNHEILEALLNAGAEANIKFNKTGYAPLHIAIDNEDNKAIELLLPKTTIDLKDKKGSAPLHIAARTCNLDLLKKLIDLGFNPHEENKDKETPLVYSVKDENCFNYLYNLPGADYKVKQLQKTLYAAIRHCQENIIDTLFKKIELFKPNKLIEPLVSALQNQWIKKSRRVIIFDKTLKKLISNPKLSEEDINNNIKILFEGLFDYCYVHMNTCDNLTNYIIQNYLNYFNEAQLKKIFLRAIDEQCIPVIKIILTQCYDSKIQELSFTPDSSPQSLSTFMARAIKNANLATVKTIEDFLPDNEMFWSDILYLLQNTPHHDKKTFLSWPEYKKYDYPLEIVQNLDVFMMLAEKALKTISSPEEMDKFNESIKIQFIRTIQRESKSHCTPEKLEIIDKLLTFGVNVNSISNPSGLSKPVLHLAVENKNFELVQFLLQKGADINLKNCQRRHALDILEIPRSKTDPLNDDEKKQLLLDKLRPYAHKHDKPGLFHNSKNSDSSEERFEGTVPDRPIL